MTGLCMSSAPLPLANASSVRSSSCVDVFATPDVDPTRARQRPSSHLQGCTPAVSTYLNSLPYYRGSGCKPSIISTQGQGVTPKRSHNIRIYTHRTHFIAVQHYKPRLQWLSQYSPLAANNSCKQHCKSGDPNNPHRESWLSGPVLHLTSVELAVGTLRLPVHLLQTLALGSWIAG